MRFVVILILFPSLNPEYFELDLTRVPIEDRFAFETILDTDQNIYNVSVNTQKQSMTTLK